MAATGLKLGTMKGGASCHMAASTEIIMISWRWLPSLKHHKEGKHGCHHHDQAAKKVFFVSPSIFTDKNRRTGTTSNIMTANANPVRRLALPWRSIWRMIIPSDGKVFFFFIRGGLFVSCKGSLFSGPFLNDEHPQSLVLL